MRKRIDANNRKRLTAAADLAYLFGAFDATVVALAGDAEDLQDVHDSIFLGDRRGLTDAFSHHGLIVGCVTAADEDVTASADILKAPARAGADNRMMGCISIKLSPDVWLKAARAMGFQAFQGKVRLWIRAAFKQAAADCEDARSCRGSIGIVLFSYETEDIIVIALTSTLEFVKRACMRIRETREADIFGGTSSTAMACRVSGLMGFRYGLGRRDDPTLPLVGGLNWTTEYEVLPGGFPAVPDRLQARTLELRARSEVSAGTGAVGIPRLAIGRNDLLIQLEGDCPQDEFLRLHAGLVRDIAADATCRGAIVSTETRLSFGRDGHGESAVSPSEKGITPVPFLVDAGVEAEFQSILRRLNESRLKATEQEVLASLVHKIRQLVADPYFGESYETFRPFILRIAAEYCELSALGLEARAWRETSGSTNISLLTTLLEYCYAARYQGRTMEGESAFRPTLGCYSGGVKFLVLLDVLGRKLVEGYGKAFTDARLDYNTPNLITATTLTPTGGTKASTWPIPAEFILLSPGPFVNGPTFLPSFVHELGHVVFDGAVYSKRCKADLQDEIAARVKNSSAGLSKEREAAALLKHAFDGELPAASEAAAFLFSVILLSSGDPAQYKRILERMVGRKAGDDLWKSATATYGDIGSLLEGRLPPTLQVSSMSIRKAFAGFAQVMRATKVVGPRECRAHVVQMRLWAKGEEFQGPFWRLWTAIHKE